MASGERRQSGSWRARRGGRQTAPPRAPRPRAVCDHQSERSKHNESEPPKRWAPPRARRPPRRRRPTPPPPPPARRRPPLASKASGSSSSAAAAIAAIGTAGAAGGTAGAPDAMCSHGLAPVGIWGVVGAEPPALTASRSRSWRRRGAAARLVGERAVRRATVPALASARRTARSSSPWPIRRRGELLRGHLPPHLPRRGGRRRVEGGGAVELLRAIGTTAPRRAYSRRRRGRRGGRRGSSASSRPEGWSGMRGGEGRGAGWWAGGWAAGRAGRRRWARRR